MSWLDGRTAGRVRLAGGLESTETGTSRWGLLAVCSDARTRWLGPRPRSRRRRRRAPRRLRPQARLAQSVRQGGLLGLLRHRSGSAPSGGSVRSPLAMAGRPRVPAPLWRAGHGTPTAESLPVGVPSGEVVRTAQPFPRDPQSTPERLPSQARRPGSGRSHPRRRARAPPERRAAAQPRPGGRSGKGSDIRRVAVSPRRVRRAMTDDGSMSGADSSWR